MDATEVRQLLLHQFLNEEISKLRTARAIAGKRGIRFHGTNMFTHLLRMRKRLRTTVQRSPSLRKSADNAEEYTRYS